MAGVKGRSGGARPGAGRPPNRLAPRPELDAWMEFLPDLPDLDLPDLPDLDFDEFAELDPEFFRDRLPHSDPQTVTER